MPAVGTPAPDFELTDQDGNTVKLSDFRGQTVILFAFPKADTPGCTKQACGFRDAFPKIEGVEATVLGISPDKPEDLKKWKDKQELPYSLLSDPDHKVLEGWGAWGEKNMFGKTFMGVLRSHWIIGADGNILDERLKISPQKSVDEAIKFISQA